MRSLQEQVWINGARIEDDIHGILPPYDPLDPASPCFSVCIGHMPAQMAVVVPDTIVTADYLARATGSRKQAIRILQALP